MSDEQKQPNGKWWQTMLISVANVGVSILLNHYLGPAAGGASAAAGTAIAHRMQSPGQKQ